MTWWAGLEVTPNGFCRPWRLRIKQHPAPPCYRMNVLARHRSGGSSGENGRKCWGWCIWGAWEIFWGMVQYVSSYLGKFLDESIIWIPWIWSFTDVRQVSSRGAEANPRRWMLLPARTAEILGVYWTTSVPSGQLWWQVEVGFTSKAEKWTQVSYANSSIIFFWLENSLLCTYVYIYIYNIKYIGILMDNSIVSRGTRPPGRGKSQLWHQHSYIPS